MTNKKVISKFSPIQDRILIESMDLNEFKNSRVIIPDGQETGKLELGRVVAIGPGFDDLTIQSKIGDYVLIPKYQAHEFTYDDVTYKIIREREVHVTFKLTDKELEKLNV